MNSSNIMISFLFAGVSIQSICMADVVTPEHPEAYEPFVLEIDVPDLYGYRSPHVDVEDKEIILLHDNTIPDMGFPSPERPIIIEVQGLPSGTYAIKTVELRHDQLYGEVTERDTGLTVFIAETAPTQKAHAFYREYPGHYFVTASDEEANEIIHPEVGWLIIDQGFNVWRADDEAPSTAVPVCRFYSSVVNSHFYTGDAEECSKLQEEDHGWEYEGIAFQALVPTGGGCPAGTDPVWRLFNNRVTEKDSNHRFVASSETYRTMMAAGWIGEGVAFCSPPATEE